VTKNTIKSIV